MAYSRDGLTMAWYARVLINSEELWILRLTSALFALEVTVAMCLFQLRSDVIVIPRYLADLTFSRASLWSLYGNLIGHFSQSNRQSLVNNLQNQIVVISSLNHESSPIPSSTSQNSQKLKNYKKTVTMVSK